MTDYEKERDKAIDEIVAQHTHKPITMGFLESLMVESANWSKDWFQKGQLAAIMHVVSVEKSRSDKLLKALEVVYNECCCDTPDKCFDVAEKAIKEYLGKDASGVHKDR